VSLHAFCSRGPVVRTPIVTYSFAWNGSTAVDADCDMLIGFVMCIRHSCLDYYTGLDSRLLLLLRRKEANIARTFCRERGGSRKAAGRKEAGGRRIRRLHQPRTCALPILYRDYLSLLSSPGILYVFFVKQATFGLRKRLDRPKAQPRQ
jgi:hypothetical protein